MTENLQDNTLISFAEMLIEKFYSKEEIILKLNLAEGTFLQYISILKKAGFFVVKKDDKYKIAKFANKLNLKPQDISAVAHLFVLGDSFFSKNSNKELKRLLGELLYLSDNESFSLARKRYDFFNSIVSTSFYSNKIDEFQKYVDNKIILNVEITNKNTYTLAPIKYYWKKDKIFFVFKDMKNKQIREFLPSEIIKMQESKITTFIDTDKEVIFELYGRVARNYLLKEEERLIAIKEDKIVVGNYSQDKTKLFKRLLRYDTLCKVVQSKKDVEEFRKIINDTLANLS